MDAAVTRAAPMTWKTPGRADVLRARRGSALLFVLVALAVVMPACLGLARAVTTAKIGRELRRDEQIVQDLLAESDVPIQDFLARRAPTLVLPADVKYPATLVLDEAWTSGADAIALSIVAWDQCGLAAIDDARRATPMRLTLPRCATEVLARHRGGDDLPGLDCFREIDGRSPFPPMPNVEVERGGTTLAWPSSTGESFGAYVATHNPGHLNVSTAPLVLLEAALRDAGRGGLEAILAARSAGRQAPIPTPASDPKYEARSNVGERFVSVSDAWAFRVDARAGRVRRSQWLQYRPQELKWRCVQRLFITGE
jgi:hypothetical protein